MPKKKNSSPVILFFAVFILMIALAVFNNFRKREAFNLAVRDNAGTSSVRNYENSLIAFFIDGQVRIWNWADIQAQPRKGVVPGMGGVYIGDDRCVSIVIKDISELVLTDFNTGETVDRFYFGPADRTIITCTNSARSGIAYAELDKSEAGKVRGCKILFFDTDSLSLKTVATLDVSGSRWMIEEIALSEDAKKIVAVGTKEGKGLMILFDVESREIILEKTFEKAPAFLSAAFSPDGKNIYMRGDDMNVYSVNTGDGELAMVYQSVLERGIENVDWPLQDITVSQSGDLIAATVGRTFVIWQKENPEPIDTLGAGHKIISRITLSPDGAYLVSCDLRASGTIVVRNIRN